MAADHRCWELMYLGDKLMVSEINTRCDINELNYSKLIAFCIGKMVINIFFRIYIKCRNLNLICSKYAHVIYVQCVYM